MENLTISSFQTGQEGEAFAFLSARPEHTFFMTGLIRDNGFDPKLNRGTFYGYRNEDDQLEGIALIGHINIFETKSLRALETLATFAQHLPKGNVLFGEREKVEVIWNRFEQSGSVPRKKLTAMHLQQRTPPTAFEPVSELRPAILDDLLPVMTIHAKMTEIETGVNPLKKDPEGYRQRTARRIEQERIWLWREQDKLIFKADIISETPEVVYIEGVYVDPEMRGHGLGARCMIQLGVKLVGHTESISLLVDEQNTSAVRVYEKAGFKLHSYYDTIFF